MLATCKAELEGNHDSLDYFYQDNFLVGYFQNIKIQLEYEV